MRGGSLRHTIQIQSATSANDAGEVTVTYTTVATRRGSVRWLSGKEMFTAGQPEARAEAEIKLRYYDGLTQKHRLVWVEGATTKGTFNIESVADRQGRGHEHLCRCTEVFA